MAPLRGRIGLSRNRFEIEVGNHSGAALLLRNIFNVVVEMEAFKIIESGAHAVEKCWVEAPGSKDRARLLQLMPTQSFSQPLQERFSDLLSEFGRLQNLLGG